MTTGQRIVKTVRSRGPISRAELARHLELSKPTVSQSVDLLMQQGVLQEVGRGRIPAGRAPRLLVFNARHSVAAGIDLGASNLRIALADLDGQMLVNRSPPTA
ncbi:MAG: hypothetical protein C4331_13870 [Meiothermus sp.]